MILDFRAIVWESCSAESLAGGFSRCRQCTRMKCLNVKLVIFFISWEHNAAIVSEKYHRSKKLDSVMCCSVGAIGFYQLCSILITVTEREMCIGHSFDLTCIKLKPIKDNQSIDSQWPSAIAKFFEMWLVVTELTNHWKGS